MIAHATLFQTIYTPLLRKEENPWYIQRQRTATLSLEVKPTQTSWEGIAEEAFHITNAPESLLSEEQQRIEQSVRPHLTHSLSVGDVVQVTHAYGSEFFLCRSSGWQQARPEDLQSLFDWVVVVQPYQQP
jgi:hypothetical protein